VTRLDDVLAGLSELADAVAESLDGGRR